MNNIQIVEEVYAAINRNDIPGVMQFFDPQVVRIEFEGSPGGCTFRGYEEVNKHFLQARNTWAEGSCMPMKLLEFSNKVVVAVRVKVKLKDRQDWIEGNVTDVFTFRDSKITEMQSFAEEQEALKIVAR